MFLVQDLNEAGIVYAIRSYWLIFIKLLLTLEHRTYLKVLVNVSFKTERLENEELSKCKSNVEPNLEATKLFFLFHLLINLFNIEQNIKWKLYLSILTMKNYLMNYLKLFNQKIFIGYLLCDSLCYGV